MSSPPPTITIRPPTTSSAPQPSGFLAPTPSQLLGTWHVTHSSLPLWKSKRNVTVTYGSLEPGSGTGLARLDDTVAYQTLTSDKIKTISGIDTAAAAAGGGSGSGDFAGIIPGVWNWRGSGWLKVASSHWEILGWGVYEGKEWAVTFFAATVFSPAGIDLYSRTRERMPVGLVDGVKGQLAATEDATLRKLGEDLFQVLIH